MNSQSSTPEDLELDTRWMRDAACAQMPGLPWIDNPARVPRFVRGLMAEVCAHCPVLNQCSTFVDTAEVTAGYWAGHSRSGKTVSDFKKRDRRGTAA